ncbi:MAG: hypothetical protein AAGK26_03440 [Pseudomonadota bacterium]
MIHVADLKMMVLAAMILLATVICGRQDDRLGHAQPALFEMADIKMPLSGS